MKKNFLPIVSHALFLIFLSQPIAAQTFSNVKDIAPGVTSSFYHVPYNEPADVNGILYFVADDGIHGKELWKTDGSAANTEIVKDITPDEGSTDLASLVNMDGILYFLVTGQNAYMFLWRSDGTEAGTYMVSDVVVTSFLKVKNHHLYFNGSDGINNSDKWISDGTNTGTVPLGSAEAGPSDLPYINGYFYFLKKERNSDDGDFEKVTLWRTDGTPSSEHQIKLIATASTDVYVTNLVVSGNKIYFRKLFHYYRGSYTTAELWTSDGTVGGTKMLASFTSDGEYPQLETLTDVNGTLFFYAGNNSDYELWKTNGEVSNTGLVKDINPNGSSYVTNLTNVNGVLYFNAYEETHGAEIWKSDGSESGTVLVQDVVPGSGNSAFSEAFCCGGGPIYVIPFTISGGRLYTACRTPEYGVELWSAPFDDCPAPASRLYVNGAITNSGSGGGWGCAIKELRDAVAIANNNAAITEIWVAKGTYKPTVTTDRNISIIINRANLKILGGFAGTETSASAASPTTNITTISGDIGLAGSQADNSYHLLRVTGVPASASGLQIDGFSFDKGNASDPNITTSDNAYGGAAIFYSNAAATPILVSRSSFNVNSSSGGGGAVGVYQGNVRFDSCLFMGNSSPSGGAAATYQAATKFSTCIFRQNTATSGSGGAVLIYTGSPVFTGTAFDRNTAAISGGAIAQEQGSAVYKQCVFSGNSSATGGGIYQQTGGSSQLVNSTFFGNTASTTGGAVAFGGGGSTITARNSIFWKNKKNALTNVAGADIAPLAGSGAGTYNNNLLQANSSVPADNGGTISSNLRGADPLFVNEGLPYGGDGWFIAFNDGLELKNSSPARNIGNNTYAAGLSADIQGKPRIACITVDLGAYENQTCPALISKNDPILKDRVIASITTSVTNPFTNSLLIRYTGAEKAEVDITTFTGQKVWKGFAIQKGQTQVNTTSWPSGLYQVTIRTATEKPLVYKVVKAQ